METLTKKELERLYAFGFNLIVGGLPARKTTNDWIRCFGCIRNKASYEFWFPKQVFLCNECILNYNNLKNNYGKN
jgi:hypothetical protein